MRRKIRTAAAFFAAWAVTSLLAPGAVAAPTSTPSEAGMPPVLEEIVVTAQRRAESLQDVPLSITALSGDALQAAGIADTQSLQAAVPGLVVSPLFQGQIYVRGIGSDLQGVGTDPSVAMHVDGVYIPRPNATLQSLYDIERVEVLRGPQGTLYGRNATGGVVNIVTRDPGPTPQAEMTVDAGNYDAIRVGASVSGPLAGDNLLGHLSLLRSTRDGFTTNLVDNSQLSDEDVTAVRGKLLWKATENLDVRLSADYTRDRSKTFTVKLLDPENSPSVNVFGGRVSPDPFKVYHDIVGPMKRDQVGTALTLDWHGAAFDVRSITAYRHSSALRSADSDGTDFAFIGDDGDTEVSDAYSQELQWLSRSDSALQWVAGLYYLNEQVEGEFRIPFGLIDALILIPATNDTEAAAAFGQLTYAFTDTLRLTGGLRYSHESKAYDETQYFNGVQVFAKQGDNTWQAWTPHAAIEYSPSSAMMLYASATRGFKSGGYNAGGTGQEYDPEYIWSYEVGGKSEWLDGTLIANLSAFWYDYTDLQVQVLQGTSSAVTNAGKAEGKGAELELNWRASSNLGVRLGLAYLDATFTELSSADPNIPGSPVLNLAGNVLPRAPELSGSLGIDYSVPLGSAGALKTHVEALHQGLMYFSQYNVKPEYQPAYDIYNASIRWDSADQRWTAGLWGRNLGDKAYRANAIRIDIVGGTTSGFYAPPRTFGISVGYRLP